VSPSDSRHIGGDVRGRPPKPAALKILEGNRGRREIKEGPKFRPIAPECPAWLSEQAQLEWGRLAPDLERLGLLTDADMADFAGYCQSYSRWVEAETVIEMHGLSYEIRRIEMREDGNTFERVSYHPRPEVLIAQKEKLAMMRFGALFGLSPSDRTRINVAEPLKDDELERMID
jgi:P27 family predicted phage terminase small subunit